MRKKPSTAHKGRKSGRQLDSEIALSLAASGQSELAAIFASPEGRKEFARELRHQVQTQQASARNATEFAKRPFTVKRMLSATSAEIVGNVATLNEAIAKAREIKGWVVKRDDGSVVWGADPRSNET